MKQLSGCQKQQQEIMTRKLPSLNLRILSEFGLDKNDPEIDTIYKKATKHIQNDLFACKGQIPEKPKKGLSAKK